MKGAAFLAFPVSTLAGSVVWSGIFNSSYTVADFDEWSWSNQIAPWQWYIHGDGNTSEYLALSSEYKNPAASDAQGLRTRLDSTSFWNGQTMQRTELIPQVSPSSSASSTLGSGHLYYHFSLSASSTNPPSSSSEHQIAFFESHFTELQYQDNTLKWNADGNTHWQVELETGKWYNFAYEIDFDEKTVGLWASNGSEALTEVVSPVSASVSSNGQDFHVGVLSLTGDGTEDWFWSGVYVESGDITKSIGSDDASSSSSSSSSSSGDASSTAVSSTAAQVESTTAAAAATSAASATSSVEATTVATTAAATPTQNVAVASSSTTSAVTTSATESTAVATPTASTPVIATPSAATAPSAAASGSAALPVPTTASEILTDVRALLTALLARQGVHARDFTV
ncbi:hypothetical protein AbraIFM66951_009704 [Aspergillus brasiliensis]|uniref:Glycoside hydrolase 131 catalytic N-terminal domain-containing protein n=1 Tax=Aspergillus brasiliensis TaxID=319629 RepID=A0A9W5YWD1_9EURO|nr:hypothetical protein AbraCBS73388_009778 [Aspergillus brasiliensis]GKZ46575.1 hypothetical protein AbraIFM66951_009704 [Aspergillus brasiliensis]